MSGPLPAIFKDAGWPLLSTSILSTSNCGNPALRLFGFGPVAADGFGIGYIIKEDGISMFVIAPSMKNDCLIILSSRCAASKHLQTRRYLHTIKSFLIDIQRILVQLHKAANEQSAPFIDHAGVLRDSKTGRPINGLMSDDEEDDDDRMRKYSCFSTLKDNSDY